MECSILDLQTEEWQVIDSNERTEKEDFAIYEGNNRHEALMRYMESRIKIYRDRVPLEEIRELCYIWNQQHCKPPLDDREFEKQWKDAKDFIKKERNEKRER